MAMTKIYWSIACHRQSGRIYHTYKKKALIQRDGVVWRTDLQTCGRKRQSCVYNEKLHFW
jgi:hypothetical protein